MKPFDLPRWVGPVLVRLAGASLIVMFVDWLLTGATYR